MWIVVLNSFSTFIFLRQGLSLNPEFTDWLDWLTSKAQGSFSLYLPSAGITDRPHPAISVVSTLQTEPPPNPPLTKLNYVRLTNKESLEAPECSVKPGLPKV